MSNEKILASALSPFSARLRISVALKQLDIVFESAPGGSGSAELKAINPFGQIPVLIVGERILVESLALLDYLEDAYPQARSLRPNDAAQAARARMIGMLFDNKVFAALRPFFAQLIGGKPDVQTVHASFDETAKELEKLATFFDAEGPAVGGGLSNADCAIAPFAWLLGTLAPKFGATSPFERVPRIAMWWATVSAVPEVKAVTDGMMAALLTFLSAKK
jgi:glutathione S-transferase